MGGMRGMGSMSSSMSGTGGMRGVGMGRRSHSLMSAAEVGLVRGQTSCKHEGSCIWGLLCENMRSVTITALTSNIGRISNHYENFLMRRRVLKKSS